MVFNVNNVWKYTNPGRWRLPAFGNTTFFVDPTNGSDSNDGLSSGPDGALLTVDWAFARLQLFDLNKSRVVVQLAADTFTASTDILHFDGKPVGCEGRAITLRGAG